MLYRVNALLPEFKVLLIQMDAKHVQQSCDVCLLHCCCNKIKRVQSEPTDQNGRTISANLCKTKIQEPQLIPWLVVILAQHHICCW